MNINMESNKDLRKELDLIKCISIRLLVKMRGVIMILIKFMLTKLLINLVIYWRVLLLRRVIKYTQEHILILRQVISMQLKFKKIFWKITLFMQKWIKVVHKHQFKRNIPKPYLQNNHKKLKNKKLYTRNKKWIIFSKMMSTQV